jgi:hypothetical protein
VSNISVYLWGVLTLYDITRGPRPLIDHVTTVNSYFNDYKSQTDPKIQDTYSRSFTCYLLSTCWQKIVRRITSWQAMGFIRFLSQVPTDEIQTQGLAWNRFPSCVESGDKTLMAALRLMADPTVIQSLLLDHIPPTPPEAPKPQIDKLLHPSSTPAPPFSKETILEFHWLVVGAFRGFTKTLLDIKDKHAKLVYVDYQAL